jgi:TPR repeat protein
VKKSGVIYSLHVVALLLLTCQFAQANMIAAYQAYAKEDYQRAITEFTQSAHLGNIEAQLKLSALHAQGVGTKVDSIMSYTYIALAGDHGHQQAQLLQQQIFNKFSAEQQQEASILWQDYHDQYGIKALQEKSLPVLRGSHPTVYPIKRLSATSTVSQQRFTSRPNFLSSVIFEFDVDVDGKVKDIEIEKDFYMSDFTKDNAMKEMSEVRYRPAIIKKKTNKKKKINTIGHRSVWAQRTITDVYVKDRLPKFYRQLKMLRKSAEAGNAYSQYQLAMYYLVFPSLEVNQVRYVDYIEKSAQAGVVEAKLEYAHLLLQGRKVSYDAEKAIAYTLQAAQAGYARAQYKLARYFLSGQVVDKNETKALFWLKKAAEQNEIYAKYWLARVYLTSKNQQSRNPQAAKILLTDIVDSQENNPNWYYYAALAESQLGHKDDAEELLEEALERAEDYAWKDKKFKTLAQNL